jgi:hypothetical protein
MCQGKSVPNIGDNYTEKTLKLGPTLFWGVIQRWFVFGNRQHIGQIFGGSADTWYGTNCCPETASRRYQSTLHNIPEDIRPEPNPDGLFFRIQTHNPPPHSKISHTFSLHRSLQTPCTVHSWTARMFYGSMTGRLYRSLNTSWRRASRSRRLCAWESARWHAVGHVGAGKAVGSTEFCCRKHTWRSSTHGDAQCLTKRIARYLPARDTRTHTHTHTHNVKFSFIPP